MRITDSSQPTPENSYAERWILEAKKIENPNVNTLSSATESVPKHGLMKRFLAVCLICLGVNYLKTCGIRKKNISLDYQSCIYLKHCKQIS